MVLAQILARIYARNPPTIAITIGGLGMLLGISIAGIIFLVGVGMQILWIFVTKGI